MIGVIADDITGANDIGIMFAKHNLVTKVYADWQGRDPAEMAQGADVLVLDTDSRYSAPTEAADRVRQAAQVLAELNCSFCYKKTCSVFRGNIGCEFDAMLDVVGEPFSLVLAAYPKNGRTTVNGQHYVHNVLLEKSAFAHDPVNPMTTSNLLEIVAATGTGAVALIPHALVSGVEGGLAERIDQLKQGGCRYAVCDAVTQADVRRIAEVAAGHRVFCGSAAAAEELPLFWPQREPVDILARVSLRSPVGGLVVAGSVTPATRAQIATAAARGLQVMAVDTRRLIDPATEAGEVGRVAAAASAVLKTGADVVVHATNAPEDVAATREYGQSLGIDRVEVSRRVSKGMAALTKAIVDATGTCRLVLAGGDTSAAICRELQIAGNWVLQEIQPGLPSCLSIGGHTCLMVLKSGSFGDAEFFIEALRHLEHLMQQTGHLPAASC